MTKKEKAVVLQEIRVANQKMRKVRDEVGDRHIFENVGYAFFDAWAGAMAKLALTAGIPWEEIQAAAAGYPLSEVAEIGAGSRMLREEAAC